ncbi:unnamed protein product [Linum tenue]|uniref:Uncharacterized protein n=1 Tax=Linum tenue TaxID=586396 RepID=A0AAV0KPS2_9ROSI|nr:unnamed protein product [Linum tenue]
MATDGAFQVAIIALTVAVFVAIQYLSKLFLSRQRANNRTALQSNRHFIQGSQFLARARSAAAKNSTQSQSLAKQALAEAESAAALSPKDPAPLVLKSVALDLLGHKAAALKAIDSALSPPRGKALQGKERGDALVKRAELKVAVNRRRRGSGEAPFWVRIFWVRISGEEGREEKRRSGEGIERISGFEFLGRKEGRRSGEGIERFFYLFIFKIFY